MSENKRIMDEWLHHVQQTDGKVLVLFSLSKAGAIEMLVVDDLSPQTILSMLENTVESIKKNTMKFKDKRNQG